MNGQRQACRALNAHPHVLVLDIYCFEHQGQGNGFKVHVLVAAGGVWRQVRICVALPARLLGGHCDWQLHCHALQRAAHYATAHPW